MHENFRRQLYWIVGCYKNFQLLIVANETFGVRIKIFFKHMIDKQFLEILNYMGICCNVC